VNDNNLPPLQSMYLHLLQQMFDPVLGYFRDFLCPFHFVLYLIPGYNNTAFQDLPLRGKASQLNAYRQGNRSFNEGESEFLGLYLSVGVRGRKDNLFSSMDENSKDKETTWRVGVQFDFTILL